ncbi:MAG TPA: hypothetical protein VM779_08265 [Thermoanaerobaculia bacterium]|nr:hypothetical protein [Thermoanaerobaculia bacterium]
MRRLPLILLMMLVATVVLAAPPASGPEGAEHHEETYFGIPGWILKTLNILLFAGLLYWLLKGPIGNALAARGVAVRAAAEQARERREKSDRLASDIQARLTQIEAEVVAIRERAEAEGERQRRELIAAAEAEAAKILQSARNEVDNRLKLAKKELTEYAGELAATRAESILRETITDEDQRKIFRESLNQVGEA